LHPTSSKGISRITRIAWYDGEWVRSGTAGVEGNALSFPVWITQDPLSSYTGIDKAMLSKPHPLLITARIAANLSRLSSQSGGEMRCQLNS